MSIRRALASERRFGIFWTGFSLTVLGDAVTKTALIWYVLDQTGSPVALGWLSFCFTAPIIVGGLAAGWLLDRFDRRYIIAIDALAKTLVVVSLPLLALFEVLPLWYVYVVASFFGFPMMIPLAGVPSMLPSLVDEQDLNSANALETIGYTMSGVVGPPAAGFLIAWAGPLDALYLDAATYLIFAWATWRCRPLLETQKNDEGATKSLIEAARIIFLNPVLASTTLMYLVFNVGLGALLVVIPVLSQSILDGGPQLFGILLGCLAVGEFVGSVITGNIRLPISSGLAICITAFLSGIGVAVAFISMEIIGIGLGLALFGVFSAPLTILGQTLRMKIIPPEYHGRCFAIMRTLMQSGGPVGGLAAGFGVPIYGERAALAGIALITCLVGMTGFAISELRRAR